jgi:hypothetical protein
MRLINGRAALLGVVGAALLALGGGTDSCESLIPALSDVFLVNTYSTAAQFAGGVATDGAGNFVIVWSSDLGGGPYTEIRAQRYDALGAPVDDEFEINTYTNGNQESPRVVRHSDGRFVVVWQGLVPSGTTGVSRRRFDPAAGPESSDLVVAGGTSGTYIAPAIAGNDSEYVVIWRASIVPSTDEIRGQRYGWDGAEIGSLFTVFSAYSLPGPEVSMDATGRFVVTWSDGDEIRARVYDATGTPLGGDFQVNTYTTNVQSYPSVAMDDNGNFVVVWQTTNDKLRGQRFDVSGLPQGEELELTAGSAAAPNIVHQAGGGYTLAHGTQDVVAQRFSDGMIAFGGAFNLNAPGGTHFGARMAPNNGRHTVFIWTSQGLEGGDGSFGVFARRGGFPDWAQFTVDERAASGGTSNVNGVLEEGERVVVDPAYLNVSTSYTLAGTATSFTGPAGPTYTIHDASADYGTIANLGVADCFNATGNCLEFEIVGTRPPGTPHWDATYTEALSENVKMTRTLHVGGSFADVPGSNPFSKYIENLFHNGITSGGACGGYCPTDGVKRQQMAVFLLKSRYGSTYVPPSPTGTVFTDVPLSNPFCMWIEDLYNKGITTGCVANPPQFCPDAIVNRQQMAVFLSKAVFGDTYDPPDCTGIFADVPCTPGTGFSDWIEDLYNRQITGGCASNPLQYCPTNPTNRQQMAAFLVKNFGLALYGP